LEDIPVALTAADKQWISTEIAKATAAAKAAETVAAEAKTAVDDLTRTRPLNGPDGKPDGTQYTRLGHHVLMQGVPQERGGARAPLHEVLAQINEAAKRAAGPAAEQL
jgi:hypothetical protein